MRQQRGATLIVSLVILLLVTLISIAGIQSALLEERMVGSQRNVELAFQAGETALADGEQWLKAQTDAPSPAQETWLHVRRNNIVQSLNWDSSQAKTYGGPELADVASAPQYAIERFSEINADDSLETGAVSTARPVYRITARATGSSTDAVVVLQSIYIK